MEKNVYLASKPRYEILDGLRGVAAIMVVCFHLFETYNARIGTQIINHGYLAVDFFFVLSGFVIGYAYDDRWGRMTTWGFFKRRLVRLHPMVIAGTLIGACLFFLGDKPGLNVIAECQWWQFALCILMGLLLLPCGKGLDIRGFSETSSLNGPSWTLMYEYIGNILYAFVLRHLPKAVLALLCMVCAVFTLDLTLGIGIFEFPPAEMVQPDGSISYSTGPHYTVIGGWSLTPDQIYIAMTRLMYPFLCGLLISRILRKGMSQSNPSGSPLHAKGGFWWCSLILVAVFSIPQIGGKPCMADGIYQALAILVLFPLVVMLGAGSRTTDERSTRVCRFLGNLSFPLYITHYQLVYLQMAWAPDHFDSPVWMQVAMNVGILFLAVFIAWACYRLYDAPVREWLTEHWLKGKAAGK